MRGAVLYAPHDIRVDDRPDPRIVEPTDAIIRLSATCICGSDLWPYRGVETVDGPAPMGHEYVGIVEEVGPDVRTIKPGQFVIGSFFASDNTCEICQAGYQSSCIHRQLMGTIGTQAEWARIPLAGGTLVATPDLPPAELIPSFLAASDALGTGWFAAVAAKAGPGKTVAVVGDGAVGLLAVLAAKQLGAERIIAMSRHEPRQKLAIEFGATDIIGERGDEGVAKIKDLTNGLGAHSTIEAVGTQESMMQAIRATRPGGHVGYVGVAHDVQLPGDELFFSHVHLHGGPAPVRRFLPELIDLIWNRQIDPGVVFDLTLPLDQASDGYRHGRTPRHQDTAAGLSWSLSMLGGEAGTRRGESLGDDRVRVMLLALFAGVYVTDFEAATKWYVRLLGGEPSFFPNDIEAVWELAEHRSIYIRAQPEDAGHSVVTVFVDDLDERVAGITSRGIEPAKWETYDNGVRKVTYRDPDGNEIGFGGGPV